MRTAHGRGEVYRTTVFAKLVGLALLKFATLDPLGMGIEMEAGRPGWYDALNGLPALFGSSLGETYELQRWLAFLRRRWPATQAATVEPAGRSSTPCCCGCRAHLDGWLASDEPGPRFPLLGRASPRPARATASASAWGLTARTEQLPLWPLDRCWRPSRPRCGPGSAAPSA